MDIPDNRPEWGKKIAKCFVMPQRYIMAIMGFFAIINAYTMRVCIGVTINRMVAPRNYTEAQLNTTKVAYCPKMGEENVVKFTGQYDWSQQLQGYILGSFYVGYVVTHIPGGVWAEKYGAKWVLSIGLFATAVATMFTPMVIKTCGSTGLIILRIITGLGEGTTFPGLSALLAQWTPKKERAIMGTLCLGGGQIGTIVGNGVSGWILDSMDWPWVFYVFGIGGFAWFIAFTLLCYSDPNSHPFIKESEKEFLFKELGRIERNRNLKPTPWGKIFTNAPVLAMVNAQIGHDWGFFTMNTNLPKYLNDVMQFPIKSNGLYSSLPFLSMWIVSMIWALVTDWIIESNCMSITNIRKINTTFAAVGPGLFMMFASYAGCNRLLVVICFTLCMGTMGPYYSGMKLGPLDMSPNYAGTLMAVSNGIGAITGFVSPSVIGLMTPNTTMNEWRSVFFLSFSLLTITSVFYCIWASGEVQPFDSQDDKDEKK